MASSESLIFLTKQNFHGGIQTAVDQTKQNQVVSACTIANKRTNHIHIMHIIHPHSLLAPHSPHDRYDSSDDGAQRHCELENTLATLLLHDHDGIEVVRHDDAKKIRDDTAANRDPAIQILDLGDHNPNTYQKKEKADYNIKDKCKEH